MSSVFVTSADLPFVLEVLDTDPMDVADVIEAWCARGEVVKFKWLPARYVVNFGQLRVVEIAMTNPSRKKPVVQLELGAGPGVA